MKFSDNIDLLKLAIEYQQAGQLEEAENLSRQAIAQNPQNAEAFYFLGVMATQQKKVEEAVLNFRQAIAVQPNYLAARNNLAVVLVQQGKNEEAIAELHQIIALNPNYIEAYKNLGNILLGQRRLDEAIAQFKIAISHQPNSINSYIDLGKALKEKGQLTEAIATFNRAINLNPKYPEAHYYLGRTLLLSGEIEKGFAEYQWRWKCQEFLSRHNYSFSQPLWTGEDLAGRTILLYAEQGFGDTIQFIRYVDLVQGRGGQIILACPPQLIRLLKTIPAIGKIVTTGDAVPNYDVSAPLISLPYILGTTRETIPTKIPYLTVTTLADAPLPMASSSLKIGIVWGAKHTHPTSAARSCSLNEFQQLFKIPDITFYSLQKGPQLVELEAISSPVISLDKQLNDFADTATAIAQLDLVITVDTAVAHLAGAMGKPVWVLLCYAPNWRWMLECQDSPWYPTMRLFRQESSGDWHSVLNRVAKALSSLKTVSQNNVELAVRTKKPMQRQATTRNIQQYKMKGIGIGWSIGSMTGWGVYGMNIALQLQQKPGLELLLLNPPALNPNHLNSLHHALLMPAFAGQQKVQQILDKNPDKNIAFDLPVLHALGNNFSGAKIHRILGKPTVGAIFFENTQMTAEAIAKAKSYDLILPGSSWNTQVLQGYGLTNVRTLIQGIDPTIFHPAPKSNLLGNRFVVFSGGKLEYRKGQDIVVAAFKQFQQRHSEALLLTAWHNFWPQYMMGLDQTGNAIGLPDVTGDKRLRITEWLVANGIPATAIIDIGPIPNHLVGQILREADVAVFANRCEGGTNLAAMESLACGVPTILSQNTGHLDLVGSDRCYPLKTQGPVKPISIFPGVEGWGESSVEEVVELLETVYNNQEEAKSRGQAAVSFMQNLTWEKQTNRLIDLLEEVI